MVCIDAKDLTLLLRNAAKHDDDDDGAIILKYIDCVAKDPEYDPPPPRSPPQEFEKIASAWTSEVGSRISTLLRTPKARPTSFSERQSAPIHRLPPETLLNVFSMCGIDDLRALSLVCVGWNRLAAEILYRNVVLHGERDRRSLFKFASLVYDDDVLRKHVDVDQNVRLLIAPRNRNDRGHLVRCVNIHCSPRHVPTGYEVFCWAMAFSGCSNLRSLVLKNALLNEEVLSIIASNCLRLRKLVLGVWRTMSTNENRFLRDILSRLDELHVHDNGTYIRTDEMIKTARGLRYLSIERDWSVTPPAYDLDVGTMPRLVCYRLHFPSQKSVPGLYSFQTNLRCLSVDKIATPGGENIDLRRLLNAFPSLRFLSIFVNDATTVKSLGAPVETNLSLKHLVLNDSTTYNKRKIVAILSLCGANLLSLDVINHIGFNAPGFDECVEDIKNFLVHVPKIQELGLGQASCPDLDVFHKVMKREFGSRRPINVRLYDHVAAYMNNRSGVRTTPYVYGKRKRRYPVPFDLDEMKIFEDDF